QRIYRADLPPTVGAGGTVDYVGFDNQAYSTDIEVREKAGTPPILQTMRAALAMELKERLGQDLISKREEELTRRAHEALSAHAAIQLMGGVGPEQRLPIFSFNIRVGSSWLHPRFVTTLLNDLFGIQSRAGCSCAGPYGHRLLHIDAQKSDEFRRTILRGNVGLKPGWARVNFHYLHTDAEVDFICRAIRFVADHGKQFLARYEFDIRSGTWRHRGFELPESPFGLGEAMAPAATPAAKPAGADPARLFEEYLAQARGLVESAGGGVTDAELKTTEKDLIPFVYV
ncbi:MAG TPA: aminotransferase class V-fold PLP-dependent enzyme, partial [bacterium]|nr:aminotransferase class V-fold PLP-dependent enzyme [bacterium]